MTNMRYAPNFGQAKHGQNGPAATVCQQCICCPICGHHFTHWTHPDISLRFRSGGRRLKKFRFFTNFHGHLQKKICRPAADSLLMLPTFHIASLNRYTPKFSGVTQKLTWCQQFGLQIFPKWGDAHICRLEMAVFRCFFFDEISFPGQTVDFRL